MILCYFDTVKIKLIFIVLQNNKLPVLADGVILPLMVVTELVGVDGMLELPVLFCNAPFCADGLGDGYDAMLRPRVTQNFKSK